MGVMSGRYNSERRSPPWTGASWIGDVMPYNVVVGDTQVDERGIAIGFGFCLDAPIYVGKIVFLSQGLSELCCEYQITKSPNDGYPDIPHPIAVVCIGDPADKNNEVRGMGRSHATINPVTECDCGAGVSSEQTTWGAMKALFLSSPAN